MNRSHDVTEHVRQTFPEGRLTLLIFRFGLPPHFSASSSIPVRAGDLYELVSVRAFLCACVCLLYACMFAPVCSPCTTQEACARI